MLRPATLLIVLSTCFCGLLQAQSVPAKKAYQTVRFEVFVRSDRDSAQKVESYLADLDQRTTGLEIRTYDVLKDTDQLRRLYKLSKSFGKDKPVLPAFYSCDRMFFGFTDAVQTGPQIEQLFTANLYTRSTCSRCKKLKAFLPQLEQRWPAIRFANHDVDRSSSAMSEWQALCRRAGRTPGLPTISFARRILVGYQGDQVTGAQFEKLIRDVSGNQEDRPTSQIDNVRTLRYAGWLPGKVDWLSVMAPPFALTAQLVDQPTDSDEDLPLDALLELPEEAGEAEVGEVYVEPESEVTDTIDVPFLGPISATELGMPLFTLAVGLIDGFNPCAMWVLVFLLSVLVNIKDRRKIFLIAGTFVFVSGAAYFAFMVFWLGAYMLVGIGRPVQIALGVLATLIGLVNVKDFFAFKKGFSLSIPESQKPGLYRRVRQITTAKYLSVALWGAVVLAVVVNMIELLCTAGLPALYTQVLSIQEYPVWKNYSYLLLYTGAYMFDDTVLVAIVVTTLSHRRLQEREGRWLKLISGLVILVMGLVMLFRPEWLTFGS